MKCPDCKKQMEPSVNFPNEHLRCTNQRCGIVALRYDTKGNDRYKPAEVKSEKTAKV